jgi:hypothetical protein
MLNQFNNPVTGGKDFTKTVADLLKDSKLMKILNLNNSLEIITSTVNNNLNIIKSPKIVKDKIFKVGDFVVFDNRLVGRIYLIPTEPYGDFTPKEVAFVWILNYGENEVVKFGALPAPFSKLKLLNYSKLKLYFPERGVDIEENRLFLVTLFKNQLLNPNESNLKFAEFIWANKYDRGALDLF